MRSLRKKLRRLKREAAEEVTEPRAAIVIDKPPDRENATETTATSSLVDDLVEEDASEEDERSNSSTSDGESDASVEVKAMTGEAAKNALGSAMVSIATAGLHYQQSIMRRAFILLGIEEKYRELLKKSDITDELFGNELFKRLKHTKSLGKVVEDLTPHQHVKKPLRSSNWGNRKSLPMKSKGHSQQAWKEGPQRSLRFKDRPRNSQWNKRAPTRSTRPDHHKR
ncbi:hypothetical protein DMN91_009867 [Ooceraea biroi]|uniref:Uncharacterized protein n=1 Tax=Ooceraea biroi TaxID=2015173 RepID=A0A3L8DBD3_OOCBI|nr:hypothetical protein DMN91_009867 [Ooceraea biroi]